MIQKLNEVITEEEFLKLVEEAEPQTIRQMVTEMKRKIPKTSKYSTNGSYWKGFREQAIPMLKIKNFLIDEVYHEKNKLDLQRIFYALPIAFMDAFYEHMDSQDLEVYTPIETIKIAAKITGEEIDENEFEIVEKINKIYDEQEEKFNKFKENQLEKYKLLQKEHEEEIASRELEILRLTKDVERLTNANKVLTSKLESKESVLEYKKELVKAIEDISCVSTEVVNSYEINSKADIKDYLGKIINTLVDNYNDSDIQALEINLSLAYLLLRMLGREV